MKKQLKFFVAAWLLCGALFTSCMEEPPRPEAPNALTVRGEAREGRESRERSEPNYPDQIAETGEASYLVSWVFEDDILMLTEPVISLLVEDGLVTTLYLSADAQLAPYSIFEDHVMLLTLTEENLVLPAEALSNVSAYIIAEDEVMLLTISLGGEVLLEKSFVVRDDII